MTRHDMSKGLLVKTGDGAEGTVLSWTYDYAKISLANGNVGHHPISSLSKPEEKEEQDGASEEA